MPLILQLISEHYSFFSSSYMVNSANFALTNKVYLFHTVILFGGHSHLKKSQQTNKRINDKQMPRPYHMHRLFA